jgi:hypothetical protein
VMDRFSLKNARKPGERRTEPPSIPTARIRYHKLDTPGHRDHGPESFLGYTHRRPGGKKSRNRKNKRKGTRKQKRNKRV